MEIEMLKNALKLVIGFSILVLFTYSTFPMTAANPVARKVAMEYLKKGIEKGTTALHWGIAAGPPLLIGGVTTLPYFLSDEISMPLKKMLPDHGEEHWIRNELKKQGMKEVDSLIFNPVLEEMKFAGYSFLNKKIFTYSWSNLGLAQTDILIENNRKAGSFDDLYSTILNAYSERDLSFKFLKPNEIRATLSHEKVHIEKKHAERIFACGVIAPFFTHFLGKKISHAAKPISFARSMLNAFLKLGVNTSLMWCVMNNGEKEADEGVVNDLEILDGGASLFYHLAAIEAKTQKNWLERILHLIDPHPDTLKRAQRFEERASELRVEQLKTDLKRMAKLHAAQQKV